MPGLIRYILGVVMAMQTSSVQAVDWPTGLGLHRAIEPLLERIDAPPPGYVALFDPNGIEYFVEASLLISPMEFACANEAADENGLPALEAQLTASGRRKLATYTRDNLQRPIAVVLDGSLLSAPTIQTSLTDGRFVVVGTPDQMARLIARVAASGLPSCPPLD